MEPFTDEQLVKQYLNGDSRSLEMLIQRYLTIIYGFVFKYLKDRDEADEVTQKTFIKVWENLTSFRPDLKFKPWLFAIAKNNALDFLKKKRPLNFSELAHAEDADFAATLKDDKSSALETIEGMERIQTLELAIAGLPDNYRVTLDLRYDQDLKFREIADMMHVSLNTAKTWHRRGIERLKKILY